MVSPKVAYKDLREEPRPLLVAGDFLNSGSGLVSYNLPELSPCTWDYVQNGIPASSLDLHLWFFSCISVQTWSTTVLLPPPQPKWCVLQKRAMAGLWTEWMETRGHLWIFETQPKCPCEQPLELTWGSVLQWQYYGYFKEVLSRVHLRGFFHGVELNWIWICLVLFLG